MNCWADEAIFYHIYPLGFCDALDREETAISEQHKLLKVAAWIPHFKELGINAIYFGPLFESYSHGYDTADYYQIDHRLGTNEDFKAVCDKLHEAGIRVVVDGVFNHVGRSFWAFKDLQEKREASPYKDWFAGVRFDGNSPDNDGFSYEGWEGHYNLVKLNLRNPQVIEHLLGAVGKWIEDFQIDGIRLDVAYSLDKDFIRALRGYTKEKRQDFWLMGEMIHGDYRTLLADDMLNSTTNYECYKGIYSSHNEKNYFEINYSLNRLFAKGGLYEGRHLYNFVDNHDVARIYSILKEKAHIFNVYTMLFTMPGIPSIYYGSEWQIAGEKVSGSDASLRPSLEMDEMMQKDQSLVAAIRSLAALRKNCPALIYGDYQQVLVKNQQLIYARNTESNVVYVALNLEDKLAALNADAPKDRALATIWDETQEVKEEAGKLEITLKPFTSQVLVFNK